MLGGGNLLSMLLAASGNLVHKLGQPFAGLSPYHSTTTPALTHVHPTSTVYVPVHTRIPPTPPRIVPATTKPALFSRHSPMSQASRRPVVFKAAKKTVATTKKTFKTSAMKAQRPAIAPVVAAPSAVPQCGGQLPAVERQNILDFHNGLRATVASGRFAAHGQAFPPASNMRKLRWDCSLERSAQTVANRCVFQHSHMPGLGENLFTYSQRKPISLDGSGHRGAKMWADELHLFGWRGVRMEPSAMKLGIGHATQMIWADSSRIGCAASKCRKPNGVNNVIFVCHYANKGNMLYTSIYQPGQTCSRCPLGTSCGRDGLCE